MSKQRNVVWVLSALTLLAVLGLMLAACGGSTQAPATTAPSQSGAIDAAALLETRCSVCHGVDRVTGKQMDAAGWEQLVTNMMQRGAQLSDAEKATLVEYLAANYGQ